MRPLTIGTLLLLGAFALERRGIAQQAACTADAQPGRTEAISILRMINTLQNHSLRTDKRYLLVSEVSSRLGQAQLALPLGGTLDVAAEGSSYLAAVTVAADCRIAYFTTQSGLIFAGAPIR